MVGMLNNSCNANEAAMHDSSSQRAKAHAQPHAAGTDVEMASEAKPATAVGSTSEGKQVRYWRERRAAAARAGAEYDISECDSQIRSLEQAAQARRPWAARMQAATDAQRQAARNFAAAEKDMAAARQAVVHFEEQERKAKDALQAAEAALNAVQTEAPRVEAVSGTGTSLDMLSATVSNLLADPGSMRQVHGSHMLEELLMKLQELVGAVRHGGAAEAAAGAVAEVQGSLAASEQPGADAPAERAREEDLPTQPMAAPFEDPWQAVLRRVPRGPAATGPQATLEQMFQPAGKGGSKGARGVSEPGPY